jgi:hypothetical protein
MANNNLVEIISRNPDHGYKAFQASDTAVNLIVRGFRFEPNTTICIGKEGIEFNNRYSTFRVVFKNHSRLPYLARTEVRSEAGRAALESVLAAFPAIGAR